MVLAHSRASAHRRAGRMGADCRARRCPRRPLTERQVLTCAHSRRCYDRARVGGVMAGCGYSIFDTAVGRCGIAWGDLGIVGVQLPEARELETRRRMYRIYPEAREQRAPLNTEIAIEGIVALLRGGNASMADAVLDFSGMPHFNQ